MSQRAGPRNNHTTQAHLWQRQYLNIGSNMVEAERWLGLQRYLPCEPDKLSLTPGLHAKLENKKLFYKLLYDFHTYTYHATLPTLIISKI